MAQCRGEIPCPPSRKLIHQETVESICQGLLDDVMIDDDKYHAMSSTFGYHPQEWTDFSSICYTDFGVSNVPQKTSNSNNFNSCSSNSNSSPKKRKPGTYPDAKGVSNNICKRQKGGDDQVAGGEKGKQERPKAATKKKAELALSKDSPTSTVIGQKTDYIHVRARRGQATDSHSLAERVRRERISERMRYLQELVPGCNKVTGKAGMLDEIINYVQSLQKQVEFLSMKIAASNPVVNFNIVEDLFGRQMIQACNPAPLPAMTLPIGQLEPSCLQLNPMQMQPAGSPDFGLEMVVNSPYPGTSRPMSAAMPSTVPGTSIESCLNVNGATSWNIGTQNLQFSGFDTTFQTLQSDCLLDNLKMEM